MIEYHTLLITQAGPGSSPDHQWHAYRRKADGTWENIPIGVNYSADPHHYLIGQYFLTYFPDIIDPPDGPPFILLAGTAEYNDPPYNDFFLRWDVGADVLSTFFKSDNTGPNAYTTDFYPKWLVPDLRAGHAGRDWWITNGRYEGFFPTAAPQNGVVILWNTEDNSLVRHYIVDPAITDVRIDDDAYQFIFSNTSITSPSSTPADLTHDASDPYPNHSVIVSPSYGFTFYWHGKLWGLWTCQLAADKGSDTRQRYYPLCSAIVEAENTTGLETVTTFGAGSLKRILAPQDWDLTTNPTQYNQGFTYPNNVFDWAGYKVLSVQTTNVWVDGFSVWHYSSNPVPFVWLLDADGNIYPIKFLEWDTSIDENSAYMSGALLHAASGQVYAYEISSGGDSPGGYNPQYNVYFGYQDGLMRMHRLDAFDPTTGTAVWTAMPTIDLTPRVDEMPPNDSAGFWSQDRGYILYRPPYERDGSYRSVIYHLDVATESWGTETFPLPISALLPFSRTKVAATTKRWAVQMIG